MPVYQGNEINSEGLFYYPCNYTHIYIWIEYINKLLKSDVESKTNNCLVCIQRHTSRYFLELSSYFGVWITLNK